MTQNDHANTEVSRELAKQAQSEAPSVDSILDSYANFKVWESKQDWEDGYDREGNIANSRNIAEAKINRLIVDELQSIANQYIELAQYASSVDNARYTTNPQLYGMPKVIPINIVENRIKELSNNLSKGDV